MGIYYGLTQVLNKQAFHVARKTNKRKNKRKPGQHARAKFTKTASVAQAITLHQQGNVAAAESAYQSILRSEPNNADANHFLGILKQQQGENQIALVLVEKSLQLSPNNTAFYSNYGNLLKEAGRLEEAATIYQAALKLAPNNPQTHYMLGNILKTLEHNDAALRSYQKALAIDPKHVEAHCNIGVIYKDREQFDLALLAYNKGLSITPNHPVLHSNISLIYRAQGDATRALQCCQKALTLDPGSSTAKFNFGLILMDLTRIDEAIDSYQQAISIRPDYIDAHGGLASALFLKGDFEAGWLEYEWGLGKKNFRLSNNYPYPLWQGESLNDKTLLVCAEQGIGDEVMFASCLQDLLAQNPKKVILECEARLQPVFRRSFTKLSVIPRNTIETDAQDTSTDDIDCKIAIGSLPKFYRPNQSAFPQQRAYLLPEAGLLEKWQQRFAKMGSGLKVGISWRGGVDKLAKTTRSIALMQWLPLLQSKAHFVNLQYGDCRDEIASVANDVTIHDWEDADPLKNIDNFVAQIAALDLVISIDNSTVHFAGAVGTPTWVLIPFATSWRWFGDDDKSLWYPSLRLFRQRQRGNWGQVLNDVEIALANHSPPKG